MLFVSDWASSLVTDGTRTRRNLGDEGKAVGCVPPTALLCEHLRRPVHFDLDQRARARSCGGITKPRRSQIRRGRSSSTSE